MHGAGRQENQGVSGPNSGDDLVQRDLRDEGRLFSPHPFLLSGSPVLCLRSQPSTNMKEKKTMKKMLLLSALLLFSAPSMRSEESPADRIFEGSAVKFDAKLAALKTLDLIDAENRRATPRLILPRHSYTESQLARIPRSLLEWITDYVDDLPNFVCDYTEQQWKNRLWGGLKLSTRHEGEIRFVNGNDDYRVLSVNGRPSKKNFWELNTWTQHFAALRFIPRSSCNYRFEAAGPGRFSFQSDFGQSIVKGYTRGGASFGDKSYPTWGTVWVDASHAIVKFEEHTKIPEGDSEFDPANYVSLTEYGLFDISGRSYWLPKRAEYNSDYGRKHYRAVRNYKNYRRFQVDSAIRYGIFDAPD